MKRQGFTLIELLIVVAIIAILAAIAVPNFLEAQTRSRVSRAANDLRSMSLAMETYRIDNNTYPASERDSPLGPPYVLYDGVWGFSDRQEADVRLLTTPISYITTVPDDVFRRVAGRDSEGDRVGSLTPAYRVYTSSMSYPRNGWMAWSVGPDLRTNTGAFRSRATVLANERSANPGIGTDKNGVYIGASTYNGMRYDATNGTVSWGDIYRWEGNAAN